MQITHAGEPNIRTSVFEVEWNGTTWVGKCSDMLAPGRKTVPFNEVAAYQISKALRIPKVPCTILHHIEGRLFSLQKYVDRPVQSFSHWMDYGEEKEDYLSAVYVFDILIGNVDRRLEHLIEGSDGILYLIDHGFSLAFHFPEERVARRRQHEPEWDYDFLSPYGFIHHPLEKLVNPTKALNYAHDFSTASLDIDIPFAPPEFNQRLNVLIQERQRLLPDLVRLHLSQISGKALLIDIDGVLTQDPIPSDLPWGYLRLSPNPDAREALQTLRKRGYSIILFTSRPERDRKATFHWLINHSIPFDYLIMGKPIGFRYIDDKALKFTTWDEMLCELHSLYESSDQA